MCAPSPPGSTMAARWVAVQATIEQFCWIGVTGTTVTFRGCMRAFDAQEGCASYGEPVVLRESLERDFGRRAKMLDPLGRRERAEPRRGAVILIARKPDQEAR